MGSSPPSIGQRKQPSPLQQQRSSNAVSPRCRRDPAWRLQTLKHNLELLILRPASPPTRLHHLEPPNLSTVLMTVHKDSSQHQTSSDKAAFSAGVQRRRRPVSTTSSRPTSALSL